MDTHVQEAYLSAMGVSLWYPRFTLPHSPELDWPIQDTPVQVRENTDSLEDVHRSEVQAVAAPSSLSQLKTLVSDEGATEGVAAKTGSAYGHHEVKAESAKRVDPAKKLEIVKPFGFLFFRYPLGLSVVVSVSDNEPLSSVELRFLNSVIEYLGVPATSEFNHRVTWPLVKQSRQFSTREFFEDSMRALFLKQAIGSGVNSFLLFGQRLSNELAELLKALAPEGQTIDVISSPELPELLTSSDAKRALWKQLIPLKMA